MTWTSKLPVRCGTFTVSEKSSQKPPGLSASVPGVLHSASEGPVVEAACCGPVHETEVPSGGPIVPELGVAPGLAPDNAAAAAVATTVRNAKRTRFTMIPLLWPHRAAPARQARMRDGIQRTIVVLRGRAVRIVLAVSVAIVLATAAATRRGGEGEGRKAVAVVAGVPISAAQLEHALERERARREAAGRRFPDRDSDEFRALRHRLLERLLVDVEVVEWAD